MRFVRVSSAHEGAGALRTKRNMKENEKRSEQKIEKTLLSNGTLPQNLEPQHEADT
jgi:hypothetical protein